MKPERAAADRPEIRPTGRWQLLKGFAYGLRQPAITGEIAIAIASRDDMRSLADALAEITGRRAPAPDDDLGLACAKSIAAWACQLQLKSRIPVLGEPWARSLRATPDAEASYEVAMPCDRMEAAKLALRWAAAAAERLLARGASPSQEDYGRLEEALKPFRANSVNAFSIAIAAHRLGLPFRRESGGVDVIGTGMHTRWMHSTETDRTPRIGAWLARRKSLTASFLRAAGLPGARHEAVQSADEAVAAAARLGYPVVVKPDDLDQGAGVAAGLENEAEVREAYAQAKALSRSILVEAHAPGWTHRLTVSHGRVIRAVKRQPGGVTGDGRHDIRQLVEREAASELGRMRIRVTGKPGVTLDEEARALLARAGLTPASVPAAGRFVRMRRRDNFNAGGTNIDLPLDAVHPDNLRLAVDAAMLLRLDLAGVDLIVVDAAVSWLQGGALICEVNAMPQLYAADDDTIYDTILTDLVGHGSARIPARLHIHEGSPGGDAIEAAVATLRDRGANGLSCHKGLFVDGRWVTAAFANGFEAARALLIRPDVRGALCMVTLDDVLRFGLPLDRWDRIERHRHEGPAPRDDTGWSRLEWMMGPHETPEEHACPK